MGVSAAAQLSIQIPSEWSCPRIRFAQVHFNTGGRERNVLGFFSYVGKQLTGEVNIMLLEVK